MGKLFPDGMPVKDGRFEGKVTVLVLTTGQIEALNAASKIDSSSKLTPDQEKILESARFLRLNDEQKGVLKKDAKLAPEKFLLYDSRKGENDCTCCGVWNVAFRFSETQIEIPHEYLVSDEKASELQIEFDREQGKSVDKVQKE